MQLAPNPIPSMHAGVALTPLFRLKVDPSEAGHTKKTLETKKI